MREMAESLNLTKFDESRAREHLLKAPIIIMLILCCLTLVANITSIIGTAHIPKRLFTTHFKLIISLAVSDILVTISVLLHIINKVVNPPKVFPLFTYEERLISSCIFELVISVNVTAHMISLFNLLAMALDHYIAIMKPLHYSRIMGANCATILIVIMWTVATFLGFSNFLMGASKPDSYKEMNMCEYSLYGEYQAEYLLIAMTFICFSFILFIYLKLYCTIKKLNPGPPSRSKDSIHNKKALVTTLIIIGTFAICWLPSIAFQLAMIIHVHLDQAGVTAFLVKLVKANKYLYILLLCNSLCDPIIYAVRLQEVQLGYLKFLSRFSDYFLRKFYDMRSNRSSSEFTRRTNISSGMNSRNTSVVHSNIYTENDVTVELDQSESLLLHMLDNKDRKFENGHPKEVNDDHILLNGNNSECDNRNIESDIEKKSEKIEISKGNTCM